MTSRCSTFMLTSFALFAGAFTLVTLALAVSTDYWLFMTEPYRMSHEDLATFNLTETSHMQTSVILHLRSGLWNVCTINLINGTIPDNCLRIDFKQDGTGRSMGAPICMTIVGAIRVAAPLPVVALLLTVSGIIMSGLGSLKRNGKTIIAAVFYILSGLSLAVGVVLFISAIYDELGYHSQTTGPSKDFTYFYGWSFYVAGSAFVSSELSAVMCVTLYLRRNARVQDMVRIIPGLEDKLQDDLNHVDTEHKVDTSLHDVIW
ncbi:voltage-dependent calcium channel gamma-5 subunit-like [Littorina saxatilis]|uniref:voltage-dependent calcium channel gamma-5 subunit-like n=1 Tax=Littorina saxatilis TaxID=31220 RepID=UPI0038B51CBC